MKYIRTDKLLNKAPASVSIEISTLCAMQCVYCSRKNEQKLISAKNFLEMKKYIERLGCNSVVLCGNGEALLHPSIYDFMEQLRNRNITLVTSGSIPIEFSNFRFRDILIFSVDGSTERLMKKICGDNYQFGNLIDNLERLSRKKVKEKPLVSMLNCTINEYNIQDLKNIILFAKQYGLTAVHYSFPWGNEEFVLRNKQEIYESLKECTDLAKKNGIFLEDPYNSFCCIAENTISPYIDIDGYYYSCAKYYYKNKYVGNIFDEPEKQYVDIIKHEDCSNCSLALNRRYKNGVCK